MKKEISEKEKKKVQKLLKKLKKKGPFKPGKILSIDWN